MTDETRVPAADTAFTAAYDTYDPDREDRWAGTAPVIARSDAALFSPAGVADLRADLIDFPHTRVAFEMNSYVASLERTQSNIVRRSEDLHAAARLLAAWQEDVARTAPLYWLARDRCRDITGALPSIPDETRLRDLFAASPLMPTAGIAVFERPIIRPGDRPPVDGIVWGPITSHLESAHLAETFSEATGIGARPLLYQGRTDRAVDRVISAVMNDRENGIGGDTYGQELLDVYLSLPRDGHTADGVGALLGWTFDGVRNDWLDDRTLGDFAFAPNVADGFTDGKSEETHAVDMFDRRVLTAVLAVIAESAMTERSRLYAQTVVTPPRGQRRTLERKHSMTGEQMNVQVVDLRRNADTDIDSSDGPAEGSDSKRRGHVVRAHARLQPYGPGRTLRRLQIIPAHWRGDRNRPMPGDRIYRLGVQGITEVAAGDRTDTT